MAFGALAALAIATAGQAVAFAVLLFGGPGSVGGSPAIGWLYTCTFLHAPLTLTSAPVAPAEPLSGGVAFALLTGTAFAVVACVIAGRATARAVPSGIAAPIAAGGAVGIVVTAIVVAVSALVAVTVALPANPLLGDVTVRASLPGTLGWTAVITCSSGAWGGVLAVRERLAATPRGSRSLAVLEGGLHMFVWSLVLGIVAVALLAATRPDASAAYVRRVGSSGVGPAAAALGHHLLALPNQSVWLLVPAMGGCDTIEAGEATIDVLCPGRVPRSITLDLVTPTTGSAPEIVRAPWEFSLFLGIPAIACVMGGLHAARRSGVRGAKARVRIGALAAIPWTVLVAIAAEAASLYVTGDLLAGGGSVRYGPPVLPAALLALLWGVGAGALGGALGPLVVRRITPGRAEQV